MAQRARRAGPCWVRVELVREGGVAPYRARPVHDAEDAAGILEPPLRREPTETFLVALLDTRHGLVGLHRCALGGIDSVRVEPRNVFTAALLANAAAVIAAHNHPSGCATPSELDVLLTERLLRAGVILGVPLLDHLVVGHGCWTSIRTERPDLDWSY